MEARLRLARPPELPRLMEDDTLARPFAGAAPVEVGSKYFLTFFPLASNPYFITSGNNVATCG